MKPLKEGQDYILELGSFLPKHNTVKEVELSVRIIHKDTNQLLGEKVHKLEINKSQHTLKLYENLAYLVREVLNLEGIPVTNKINIYLLPHLDVSRHDSFRMKIFNGVFATNHTIEISSQVTKVGD